MRVRIATGDHEGETADEFKITFFANDLSHQSRALLVRNLIVLEPRRQTNDLSKVLLVNPPAIFAIVAPNDQHVSLWVSERLKPGCKRRRRLKMALWNFEASGACPLESRQFISDQMGEPRGIQFGNPLSTLSSDRKSQPFSLPQNGKLQLDSS